MIALLQRVSQASVVVDGREVGAIGRGLLVLVGVKRGDDESKIPRLVERLLTYRVFPDSNGKMNLSVREAAGAVLLVPQFTLAADTSSGTRPSFTPAAAPADAERLFSRLVEKVREQGAHAECGVFGADMKVTLTNDGPVTLWLEV
jgi:D-aminoacyl-tRNA deacylase